MALTVIKTYAFPTLNARAFAFNGHYFYVLDVVSGQVMVLSQTFQIIRTLPTTYSGYRTIASDGKYLYMANPTSKVIVKTNLDGVTISSVVSDRANIGQITFNGQNLFVSDATAVSLDLTSLFNKIIKSYSVAPYAANGLTFLSKYFYTANNPLDSIVQYDSRAFVLKVYVSPDTVPHGIFVVPPYFFLMGTTASLIFKFRIYN